MEVPFFAIMMLYVSKAGIAPVQLMNNTPKGISSFNDLANRRLQPLGHPSAGAGPHPVLTHHLVQRKYTAYAGRIPSFECAACQTEMTSGGALSA